MLYKKHITMKFKENQRQKEVADHSVYLQLKKLKYTNEEIANHLSYTNNELSILISKFELLDKNLNYQIQEVNGNYMFNGDFFITKTVFKRLPVEVIQQIRLFTQEMIIQHRGIDYIQVFTYKNQKLFFIDQLNVEMLKSNGYEKEDNYCTLLFANEY